MGKSGSHQDTDVLMVGDNFLEYAMRFVPPNWYSTPGLVGNIRFSQIPPTVKSYLGF